MSSSPLLSVTGLTKTYPGVRALSDFNLQLLAGEIHGLAGVNGAGKSTIIKILSGVEKPSAGSIEVPGNGIVSIDGAGAAQRLGIGVVHQELPLLPNLTAAENMVLGLEGLSVIRRASRRDAQRRYREIARRFDGAPAADARLAELGLYAWQIVAIIRAVSMDARILILDEPTSSLSTNERRTLHVMLADLVKDGIAILYVSHFLDDILEAATSVSVVRDGRLVHRGPTAELNEASLLAHMTGEAAELPARTRTDAGRRSGPSTNEHRDNEQAALVVKELQCGRLRPTSFSVRRGERLGMYGLEGSGARDVLEAIFGLRRRTGEVEWNGRKVKASTRDAIGCGLALVTGDRKRTMLPGASVAFNHILPTLSGRSLFAQAPRGAHRATVDQSIAKFSIKATPEQAMSSLSGGNQQKVLLGRWMERSGLCLMLDEPTRGVDLGGRLAIHHELLKLAAGGATLVVHSTDPEEIVEVCDRVLVFADGQRVGEVSGPELSASRLEHLTRDRSLHRIAE
jgi:ABC-type sugar transport system ATPase subunit